MNGIITYHKGYNFGAYLQVYSLQKYLDSEGVENSIIDYRNRRHVINEYRCFLWTKNAPLVIKNVLKIGRFIRQQSRFKISSRVTSEKQLTDVTRSMKTVFFGSDEIWNFKNPLLSKDLVYFGAGCSAGRVSYAASFGSLPEDTILPADIKNCLSTFKAISVRDENSRRIIERNLGISPTMVVDPTLLYSFDGAETNVAEKDFIMVYSVGIPTAMQAAIRDYAGRKGLRLISVGWNNCFCDENKVAIDPFQFLGYVKKASAIITTMFHGAMFSIKYRKNFALLKDPYRTNKLSILKTLNLDNRMVEDASSLSQALGQGIDYVAVDALLQPQISASKAFLTQCTSI